MPEAATAETIQPGYLRPKAAAPYMGVSPRTLEDWRKRGEGPPFIRLAHHCVLYRKSDIDDWFEKKLIAA